MAEGVSSPWPRYCCGPLVLEIAAAKWKGDMRQQGWAFFSVPLRQFSSAPGAVVEMRQLGRARPPCRFLTTFPATLKKNPLAQQKQV